MIECEHKPEWIRERENGDRYCAVCRSVMIDEGLIESTRQGGSYSPKLDGWRRVGDRGSESIE